MLMMLICGCAVSSLDSRFSLYHTDPTLPRVSVSESRASVPTEGVCHSPAVSTCVCNQAGLRRYVALKKPRTLAGNHPREPVEKTAWQSPILETNSSFSG